MVLTYGSESWCCTKALENTLNSFENKCLRKIRAIRRDNYKTNQEVREITQQPYISNVITKKRLKFSVEALRTDNKRLPKAKLFWILWGQRRRGRPKTPKRTLKRTLQSEGRTVNNGLEAGEQTADNRERWRILSRSYVSCLTGRWWWWWWQWVRKWERSKCTEREANLQAQRQSECEHVIHNTTRHKKKKSTKLMDYRSNNLRLYHKLILSKHTPSCGWSHPPPPPPKKKTQNKTKTKEKQQQKQLNNQPSEHEDIESSMASPFSREVSLLSVMVTRAAIDWIVQTTLDAVTKLTKFS